MGKETLKNNDALLNIPFDQYQRYRTLGDIVEIIKGQSGNRALKILDVGGHSTTMEGIMWLPIKEFIPDDNTVIIDLPSCNISSYIKGSGEKLPFKVGSFDIVSCQDVLEHVPFAKREKFISDLINTANDFIIIGCPFYSENSVLAEKIFFEYINKKIGYEHNQLKEHITCGLPKLEDIEQILVRNKVSYSVISSGYIYNWLLMNLIKVYISSIPDSLKLHTMIDRFYNMNFYESDQREPSYRNVVIISKRGDTKTLDGITEKFKALREKYKHFSLEKADFSLLQLLLNLENLEKESTINKFLHEKEMMVQNLHKTVYDKENHIKSLEKELNEIKESKFWMLFSGGKKLRKGVKILIKEGPRSLMTKIKMKNQYAVWLTKNSLSSNTIRQMNAEIDSFKYKPTVSIVMPVYNVDKKWLEEAIDSVLNQIYTDWELCIADDASTKEYIRNVLNSYQISDKRIKVKYLIQNHGISGATKEALSLAVGEFIGFLDNDDKLHPSALYEAVKLLNENRDIDFIYSDEDIISTKGKRFNPHFKPNLSPDTMRSYNYITHFAVIRKKVIDEAGGIREGYDGSQDYDLFLRVIEKTERIAHIPKVLYHWRAHGSSVAGNKIAKMYAFDSAKKALKEHIKRIGMDGEIYDGPFLGSYHIKYHINSTPKVSIIIPNRDKVDVLKRCITSILHRSSYRNYEILIIDNQSVEKDTFKYYQELKEEPKVRILSYNKPFNFSAINNYAVSQTDSEHIIFLNNDTEVISSDWIGAMLEFSQRKDVGAVGALLCYPNNTIQHAGVLVGICGFAGHSHKHFSRDTLGYMGRVKLVQNLSAVTGACMMTKKNIFNEIGGFDENYTHAVNDVDFCLKIREKGYLIVYTPYAELYHYESLSRGYEDTPEKKERFNRELKYFKERWNNVINKGDPYYNPNLTLDREDFSIKI